MRLCWQVLMWTFFKAVLAGAGRSSGLSVRLCWGVVKKQTTVHVGFLCVCPFLDWAFCEAVLAGSHVGFL